MNNHGNSGKRNAAKLETDKSTANIYARCKNTDKALWEKSANYEGIKLTEWIVNNLNKGTKMSLEKQVIQTIKSTTNTEALKAVVTNFLSSIGRNDLIQQSYDEAAYELTPSIEASILTEAVNHWEVLIKDEYSQ